jgi:MoCo/4Fe-4S cofactor protein with predicted Tat translocation signal
MAKEKVYWNSLEHLNGDEAFLETAEKEFKDPIPVDEFVGKQEFDSNTTNRRDFLKFVGFSIGAATLAACETPVIKSIPYVSKPEEVYPGVANWYASTYCDGSEFANIMVKTREGRPIFIKGNPNGPVTKGGVSARIVSSVLNLYDDARYQYPTKDGSKISWANLDSEVMSKMKEIVAGGQTIAVLSKSLASPSTLAAFGVLGDAYMAPRTGNVYDEDGEIVGVKELTVPYIERYTADTISYNAITEANSSSFWKADIPTYDFSKAKVIVSVGADFLNGWLNSNAYSAQYTSRKNPDGDWMSRHYQFEANLSLTGSNAEVRAAVKPSEYGKVLANIHDIISKKMGMGGGKSYDVDNDNGAMEKAVAAANELWANRSNSLVVCGTNNPDHQILANAINHMLGNYGNTIDLDRPYQLSQGRQELAQLIEGLNNGRVGGVIFYGTNPMYTAPGDSGFSEALAKAKLTVSLADRPDETSVMCQYVAPDNHYLESWNDYEAVSGEMSLAQPVIKRVFDTRQAQSTLLRWAGADNYDYYNFLTSNWEKNIFTRQSKESYFKAFWNQSLHDGYASVGTASMAAEGDDAMGAGLELKDNGAAAAAAVGKEQSQGWELELYTKTSIGDGRMANNPHLQEMPDPISRISWDNYVTMNPADMADAGYETRTAQETPAHTAKVTANGAEVVLPVIASPGQKRNTIGIALGYGRTETGKAGNGVGANAYPMTSLKNGNVQYSASGVNIEKTGETYAVASIQTHHTMMGRKIVNETDAATYKTDRKNWNPEATMKNAFGEETPVSELDLWNEQPGIARHHLWGMSIDLNACTGCGACVTSCHINNNVPVVGKDEIRRTRSMFWLRIDRYYSSDADPKKNNGEKVYDEMENPSVYPDTVFQPVMCQHCNHAPCETVCPVAATTHSSEGFNQMAYNRCVGTRYCANNCPYKVRRFNWFDYNVDPKFDDVNPSQTELGRMVLNPDVVVRSRGVMEKCSLCVQDVQAGKLQAKKEGRPVRDGEIQTACSAACANGAIVFGDLNDDTMVAKRAGHDRSYALLEEVGTRPNVSYMTKVRNRSGAEV